MITRALPLLLCLAACAGPPPLTLEQQLNDNAFNRAFGLPTETPSPGAWKHPPPVPPDQVEVIPRRPRGALMWQPSSWEWTGRDYVWVKGTYVPKVPDISFVRGHWEPDTAPEYFVWTRGGWQ
jgi:hypothetical protein